MCFHCILLCICGRQKKKKSHFCYSQTPEKRGNMHYPKTWGSSWGYPTLYPYDRLSESLFWSRVQYSSCNLKGKIVLRWTNSRQRLISRSLWSALCQFRSPLMGKTFQNRRVITVEKWSSGTLTVVSCVQAVLRGLDSVESRAVLYQTLEFTVRLQSGTM